MGFYGRKMVFTCVWGYENSSNYLPKNVDPVDEMAESVSCS